MEERGDVVFGWLDSGGFDYYIPLGFSDFDFDFFFTRSLSPQPGVGGVGGWKGFEIVSGFFSMVIFSPVWSNNCLITYHPPTLLLPPPSKLRC